MELTAGLSIKHYCANSLIYLFDNALFDEVDQLEHSLLERAA